MNIPLIDDILRLRLKRDIACPIVIKLYVAIYHILYKYIPAHVLITLYKTELMIC